MHIRPRPAVCLLAVGLAAALLPTGAATAAPLPVTPGAVTDASRPDRVITLVTGDRLAISTDGAQRVTSLPSPGRRNTRFVSRNVNGHLEVVPADALPLLTASRLDPRLFDVTQLLADGFGDESTTLPLIISASSSTLKGLAAVQSLRELKAVHAQVIKQRRSDAATVWKSLTTTKGLRAGITHIWLDGIVHTSLDVSVPQIGAPTAWAAGYRGEGIGVGVIDTGIDTTHPDLKDAVVESVNFLTVPGAPPGPPEDDKDYKGHGTHVASIIAGRGTASDGKYTGVAPAAKIYNAKACNRTGSCSDASLLAAMQWAAEKKLRVVNMSLGRPDQAGMDLLEQGVQTLTEQYGTLFVVASGNDGGPASSPSTAPDALSVGAVDKQDALAPFSSGGSVYGDLAAKPEVTAPGVDITAAQSSTRDGGDGNPYVTFSGTSMATPHVAGAAVLLAQEHPDWTHTQLKDALVSSAKPNADIPTTRQGAGRIDVARAISQQVTADPASLSFGEHDWPHTDDQPVTHMVTYTNSGTEPVTLAVSSTATNPDGSAAPAQLVSLSATSVTVPAGGSADVAVTVNPAVDTPTGYLSGLITASGGGTSVGIPWVVYKDIRAYKLTITHLDRNGQPTVRHRTYAYAQDGSGMYGVTDTDATGVATLRLTPGRYTLDSLIFGDSGDLSSLVAPTIKLDQDMSVTLDARIAEPIAVTVADSDAQQYFGNVHTTVRTATGWWLGQDMTGGNFDGMYAGQVGPDDGSIATAVSASWAKPDADGSISNSPDLYNLAWNLRGQYITGFERAVAPSDLATVDTKFGSELDGSDGGLISSRRLIGDIDRGWAVYAGVASLPTRRLIHYNSDGNTQFRQEYVSGKIVDDTQLLLSDRTGPYTAYQSGKQYSERWNYGVYGPAFPVQQANMGSFNRPVKITRTANRIVFWPSLVSDTTGWTADSMNDVESLTVTHNGETVYQGRSITDGFDVPTDVGDYSATVALTRSAPAELSTKVTTTWTFRSGTTKLEQRLPVAAIRFDPDLDDDNTAPAGARFALPVSVEGQSGSGVGSTSALSVEVSYDDGKTWRPAPTIGAGDHRIAFVQHPAGHGFVSLRANASSTSGSTVEETILRAYRF